MNNKRPAEDLWMEILAAATTATVALEQLRDEQPTQFWNIELAERTIITLVDKLHAAGESAFLLVLKEQRNNATKRNYQEH